MLAKSLVSKSYKRPRYKTEYIFRGYGRGDITKYEEVVTEVLMIKKNQEVGILGVNTYTYKDGFFYNVINIKDEVFSLDYNEIDFTGILKAKEIVFVNKTPKFIDCIEPEPFDLDNL